MEFSIKCETYARFAKVARLIKNYSEFSYLCSIRVECKKGYLFLFTSNSRIAIAENLGVCDVGEFSFDLIVDDKLIEQCETETQFNGSLNIVYNQVLTFASIRTSFGYEPGVNGLAVVQGINKFENWRDLFPVEQPDETNASVYFNADNISALADASPSGMVGLQKFVDGNKPVIVRDLHNPNWVGLFLPYPDRETFKFPIKLPDWVKV